MADSELREKRVTIAGGNGFLGRALATYLLSQGADVTVLSRQTPIQPVPWNVVLWDGRHVGDWVESLEATDGLVNLVGRTVNCIKTPDHRDEILRSRVESTLVLGKAMRMLKQPPQVWVQMSTAHIYGDPPSALCDEESPYGLGLAPTVARAWEEAFQESHLHEQRAVVMRTSFVIGKDRGSGGGALATLKQIARWGLGGTVGRGSQGMSWIHEDDWCRLFCQALSDSTFHGAYIATSPNPVSQKEFMKTLRQVLRVPFGLPAWEWMVRLGAPLLMRTDPELILYGRYVHSGRLAEQSFEFRFPDLQPALEDLLSIK